MFHAQIVPSLMPVTNKLFSDEEILSMLSVTLDQYYNPAGIRREFKSLKKRYLIEGKLDIAIMDDITISNNSVTARINISEGSTYRIQNIYINGIENVKEKYVIRELSFSSGEFYNKRNQRIMLLQLENHTV